MVQIIEQTDEQKMAMYMKLEKEELASMLIQSNKTLEFIRNMPQPVPYYVQQPFQPFGQFPITPMYPTITYTGHGTNPQA